MKLFTKAKDGGPESPVDAFFIIEWKSLFSIAFLKFNKGKREQYHTHAFNALTWFLKGNIVEDRLIRTFALGLFSNEYYIYERSILPKYTSRDNNHRVEAFEDSWCFTIRGPWSATWTETDLENGTTITLAQGRKILNTV